MKNVIISGSEDLIKLLRHNSPGLDGELKLKISRLDSVENEKYEKLLNKVLHACGCETGAVFSFISICICIIYWFANAETVGWIHIRNGMIVIFIAALIGKLTGILVAKVRFRRTVRNLLGKLEKPKGIITTDRVGEKAG